MGLKIKEEIQNNDWDISTYDWRDDAQFVKFNLTEAKLIDAQVAWRNAGLHGTNLGYELFRKGYSHIHFIAHSAGSNLLQSAVEKIVEEYSRIYSSSTSACNSLPIPDECFLPLPTIHSTFLDAYVPEVLLFKSDEKKYGIDRYGKHATWAEHYVDKGTIGDSTDLILSAAFNFDVTQLDPTDDSKLDIISRSIHRHSWPHIWYSQTIDESDTPDFVSQLGFGFSKSLENGGTLPSHQSKAGIQRYHPRGEECNLKTEANTCGRSIQTASSPGLFSVKTLGSIIDFLSALKLNDLVASTTGIVTLQNSSTARLTTGSRLV